MRPWSALKLPVLALGLLLAVVAPALALETKPYDAEAFKAGQSAGKPALIHVHAPWCPTCKAQQMILEKLKNKPEYADLTVYEVDFDNQKDVVKDFDVRAQSTLIAYKGDKETGRTAGDASFPGIEALIETTR